MSGFRSKMKQVKYLVYFVTRSFLITILCFMSLICLASVIYFGDMFASISKGIYKNPLFGAYVIVSPSMVPTIKIDDAIVIKRVDNDKYKVGDIITFSSMDNNYLGKAVTHRIVDKKNYTSGESIYTTKGDNNAVVDATQVKTSDIYGKVLFKIPAVGTLEKLVARPSNFFLSLLIPTVIFIVYEMMRIVFMMSKRKV